MKATANEDGTYTVRGGGWFWARLRRTGSGVAVVESAPGMMAKKAAGLFLTQAKRAVERLEWEEVYKRDKDIDRIS